MKKRVVAGLLTVAMAVAMMSGCGKSQDTASETAEESYTLGIIQFAEHGSLDNCREGFLNGLESE